MVSEWAMMAKGVRWKKVSVKKRGRWRLKRQTNERVDEKRS